jgi:hypothetical protein
LLVYPKADGIGRDDEKVIERVDVVSDQRIFIASKCGAYFGFDGRAPRLKFAARAAFSRQSAPLLER